MLKPFAGAVKWEDESISVGSSDLQEGRGFFGSWPALEEGRLLWSALQCGQ